MTMQSARIKLLVSKIADAAIEGAALRKDVEVVEMAPISVSMPGAEEAELSDEELLGAATLAKITPKPSVVEEEVISEEESLDEKLSEAEEEVAEEESLEEKLSEAEEDGR